MLLILNINVNALIEVIYPFLPIIVPLKIMKLLPHRHNLFCMISTSLTNWTGQLHAADGYLKCI